MANLWTRTPKAAATRKSKIDIMPLGRLYSEEKRVGNNSKAVEICIPPGKSAGTELFALPGRISTTRLYDSLDVEEHLAAG
jgi:hypothetical protein